MAKTKPNILLIMADQLVPQLTGAYGHNVVQTPNLDRLSTEGITFDAAYSPCPLCVPARASMMTGMYMSNIGAYDNASPIPIEQPTLAHYMTIAGYDTVLAGKMHFIGPDQLHGFRTRFNTNIYPADFSWASTRGAEHQVRRKHAQQYLGENIHVGRWNQFLSYDEETHLRAREYLHAKGREKLHDAQGYQPFFLCVSYHHPHEPFWPPQALWDLYEDEPIDVPEFPDELEQSLSTLDRWLNTFHGVEDAAGLRDPQSLYIMRRAYYALVTYIDLKLGELLDALVQNDLEDNTLIIFCSDHGDMLGEKGMVQKRTFHEWSSRVPLIMHFPEGGHKGRRIATPVNLIDLLPTLLEMVDYPLQDRLALDGVSLLGLIENISQSEAFTFSEYHAQGAHAPCFMVREGVYKYIYIHGYDELLFDLENDPGEWRNLATEAEHAENVRKLRGRILEKFDPDAIDRAISKNIPKKLLIKQAMKLNKTKWDYQPHFNPSKSILAQYLPGDLDDGIPR